MKQSTQLYQRLSADIIEQGNRVLSSTQVKPNSVYTENIKSPSVQPLPKRQQKE